MLMSMSKKQMKKIEELFKMKKKEELFIICARYKSLIQIFLFFFIVFFLDVIILMGHPAKLSFGGWVYVCRTAFVWSILFVAPLLIFSKKAIYLYLILFPLILLIVFCETFSRIHFNQIITGNLVYILVVSSIDEIWNFIKLYTTLGSVCFICIYIFICTIFYKLVRKSIIPKNALNIAIGILCVIIFFLNDLGLLTSKKIETIFSRTLVGYLPIDIIKTIQEYHSLMKAVASPELPDYENSLQNNRGGNVRNESSQPLLGIIVVGESATRNSWGIYGYSRNTTPEMKKYYDMGELIVWNDIIGAEPSTCLALLKLFSQQTIENSSDFRCTIFDVMNSAGINTVLLSSQNQWGNENGQLIAVFANIKSKQYTIKNKSTFDDALIDVLATELSKYECRTKDTVIIVHFTGSHFPPEKYHPISFAPFNNCLDASTEILGTEPERIERYNHYDNTIAFTDKQLGRIVKILKEYDRPSFMFYISDHGETPRSNKWRDFEDNDLWEIPMIAWLSPRYRQKWPDVWFNGLESRNAKLQSDKLFWPILSLCQIKPIHLEHREQDFFSNLFKERKAPRLIQYGKKTYQKSIFSAEN